MQLHSGIAAAVTGGASGLGAATALALAAKGLKVAVFNLQHEKVEALAAEIGSLFCEAPFPQRLSRPDKYAAVALTMIECGYFNGEDVRLEGGIRMAPR